MSNKTPSSTPGDELKVENLESNRETLEDLAEREAEEVQGGLLQAVDPRAGGPYARGLPPSYPPGSIRQRPA